MTVRRLVLLAAAAAVAGVIASGALVAVNLLRGTTGGPVQAVRAPADVVARGKYLAEAADCAACHSAPGGDPRVFRVDGSEVALRRETAKKLILRQTSDTPASRAAAKV